MIDKKDLDAPTEKQYNFARVISEELEIPLPENFSKSAYSNYIRHNLNKFKKSTQRYNDEDEY